MDISLVLIALLAIITAAVIITIYECIPVTWGNQQRPVEGQLHGPGRRPDTGHTGDCVGVSMPPTRIYMKGEGVVSEEQSTCPVCLSDFKDGEPVRLLPECLHCFHVQCIDMWMTSNASCPMCRAATVPAFSPVDSRVAVVAAMQPDR